MSTMSVILNLMEQRQITQKELCSYLGIGEPKFSDWKKGKIKSYNKYLPKIAAFFDISLDYLINGGDYTGGNVTGGKKIPKLGKIRCGNPEQIFVNFEEFFEPDKDIAADYCLVAKGDSMINARIFDGDIVFIRKQPDVENGEIAAVIIGDEATLKRVYKYDDKIELRAENPLYNSLYYEKEQLNNIRIVGKAVAFQSTIK